MKKKFILLLTTLWAMGLCASEISEDSIYVIAAEPAYYAEGNSTLMIHLADQLMLDDSEIPESGRTVVKTIVEKDGQLVSCEVAKSCGFVNVDSAAMTAINHLPPFVPAKNGEDVVRSYTYISVVYSLVRQIREQVAEARAKELESKSVSTDEIYDVVDQMPEFPGGQEALFRFLAENVRYPQAAQQNKVEGRTLCEFVVNKDGRISDVVIVQSSGDYRLDREAIRVIRSMPRWKGAIQRGKPVRVKYTLPVNFRLR